MLLNLLNGIFLLLLLLGELFLLLLADGLLHLPLAGAGLSLRLPGTVVLLLEGSLVLLAVALHLASCLLHLAA